MKIKKVEVKKIVKLLKKNEKLLERVLENEKLIQEMILNPITKGKEILQEEPRMENPDVRTEAVCEVTDKVEVRENPSNSITLSDTNWKEYLTLLTTEFEAKGDEPAKVDILLDCSGSNEREILRKYLYSCKDMMQLCNVRVGCFDTEFYGYHTLKNEEDIENFKFEGGGGTDLNVAVQAFDENVPNHIIFTDGYDNTPKDSKNAYYIVYGDKSFNPINGKVIYLNGDIIINSFSTKK